MSKLAHVGKALPSYAKYLHSSSASKCIDRMLKKEKGGKVLVKFFEEAVLRNDWQNDKAFRGLLEAAVKKADSLNSSQKTKFSKAEKVFNEKLQKGEQKSLPKIEATLTGEEQILKTIDKIGKLVKKQGFEVKGIEGAKAAMVNDLQRIKAMREERKTLLVDIEQMKKELGEGPEVRNLQVGYMQTVELARKVIITAKEKVKEQHVRLESSAVLPDNDLKQLFKVFTEQFEQLCDAELNDSTLNPLF